ncbi:hypothetical protein GMPD_01000 [Geomonas paludis]|uniref:Uncharacterized protein n=1 Tax=Geomonas paludis TaxID=2740185 RepID=A0A6V8MQ94_9BACT|nr:hypothetical protein GMPD_01000 [Geomonas paludis]
MHPDAGQDEGAHHEGERDEHQREAAGDQQDQHQFFANRQAADQFPHGFYPSKVTILVTSAAIKDVRIFTHI